VARVPVRALTLGVAEPHPLPPEVLESSAASLFDIADEVRAAGYDVQTVRFSTRPMLSDLAAWAGSAVLSYTADLQRRLDAFGIRFCSLGPALPNVAPGRAELLAEVIAGNPALSGSVMVATSEGGLDMRAVRAAARTMVRLGKQTSEGLGNFNFAALACVAPGGPFFPASYQGVATGRGARGLPATGAAPTITLALQGAGVIAAALEGGAELHDVTERVRDALLSAAGPVASLVEDAAAELGVAWGGTDLSPAPNGRDSIGAAMEQAGLGMLGSPGTLALAAAITAGIQGTTLLTCGYNGLMLPVMEDAVLAERWAQGAVGLDQLLAYSAVCGTGLDMVPFPGDSRADDLVGTICDVASLALRLHKPLSARLLPAPGKAAGDQTSFSSPYVVNTTVRPLRSAAEQSGKHPQ